MPVVHRLPYEFVNSLVEPGLATNAGLVPLRQYLALSKGNKEISDLLAALRTYKITDSDTHKTADGTVTEDEIWLLWKGQGTATSFIKLMNFLWDNQEQLEGKPGVLGQVYAKYFKPKGNPFVRMVKDKYFGIDCIGFVANYLRWVGIWPKYKGVAADQWVSYFPDKVQKAEDVETLNIMIWPGSHVALVDWVHDYIDDKRVLIDMCQSSKYGPQCNASVTLTDSGTYYNNRHKLFQVGGGYPPSPVGGYCYIMRWTDLSFLEPPERPVSQSGGQAASGRY